MASRYPQLYRRALPLPLPAVLDGGGGGKVHMLDNEAGMGKNQKKKRKKKAYGLRTFAEPHCPVDFYGAFRDNVRVFVRECCDAEEYNVCGMPVWCTMLVDEITGVVVPMYTVEEMVKYSSRPSCDFCRRSGECWLIN